MMLPNELVWIMEKLGFEWPDIDEDEVTKGADLLRGFGNDLETVIQAVDRQVNNELVTAIKGQTGPATMSAWNTNRSQNLQKLIDLMPPAAGAMDVGAVAITALKVKVIVDVSSTLIALIKNSTVASVIGASEAAGLMATIVENETGGVAVFFLFALGFVILTLPLGVWFTSLSRRLAVKR